MAEIYRNSVNKALTFSIPASDATVVAARISRLSEVYTATPAVVDGSYVVAIPWDITRFDGAFFIQWAFKITGKTYGPADPTDPLYTVGPNPDNLIPYDTTIEEHDIVTPVFTRDELIAWDSDFTQVSNEKVVYLESLVRNLIETYCGQSFGYRSGTMAVKGTGTANMLAPERIVTLDAPFNHLPPGYGIHWGASSLNQPLNVKIPYQEEILFYGRNPKRFVNGRVYTFTGTFGWLTIPEAVKNAALYIAESFSCNESLWRERYIKSIRAADWRFDYSEETFRSTGSLVADQLLDPYVRTGATLV